MKKMTKKALYQSKLFYILNNEKINIMHYYIIYKIYQNILLDKEERLQIPKISKYINQTNTGNIIINEKGVELITKIEKLFNVIPPSKVFEEIMTFGKYKGKRLKTIPLNYLKWMSTQKFCPDQVKKYIKEEFK